MKSIKDSLSLSIVINKSEFITTLFPVTNVDEVLEIFKAHKIKYSDASHHCYGYIIGDNQEVQKYSDDGEPSKTAGLPIIEVLKKHDLTNILAITVRYYGGIKLGAGGLTRAYIKGPAQLIEQCVFTHKEKFLNITVTIDFDQIGKVEKYLRDNYLVKDVIYETGVTYHLLIKESNFIKISNHLNESLSGKVTLKIIDEFSKYV